MTKVITEAEAEDLLQHIRSELRLYGLVIMQGRLRNTQTLVDLNLTAIDVRKIVDALTIKDYCGDPDADEKYPWKIVAVFGKMYNGTELYIKLSLGFDGSPVVCLSFHSAEFSMVYQFK